MSRTPLASDEEIALFRTLLNDWVAPSLESGLLESYDGDSGRWLLRFHGEERQIIAVWLTLRQRTVYVESELMPAPEENAEEIFRFLLTKNAELYPVHAAIGPENGIYLVTRFPIADATEELLDEIVGATLTFVDTLFPTVMTLGFPGMYRRRRRG